MQRSRSLIVAAVTAALAISVIATLVMGASTRTRIIAVNGVPGQPADICLNGKERVSGLRYGKSTVLEMNNSPKVMKFTKAAGGRPCSGNLLGKRTFDPPPGGWDLTFVVTPKGPKRVAVFDNMLPADPGEAIVAWRYAGNLGKVLLGYQPVSSLAPIPPQPAASPSPSPFSKGDEFATAATPDDVDRFRLVAKKAKNRKTLARTPFTRIKAGKLQQVVLVGNKGRNARFARINVPLRTPSPSP